jgi:hypothetical protein
MIGFLALLPRSYGSSNSIPISAVPLSLLGGASRPFSWRQRLSWLISALSGTVELEVELAKSAEIDEL